MIKQILKTILLSLLVIILFMITRWMYKTVRYTKYVDSFREEIFDLDREFITSIYVSRRFSSGSSFMISIYLYDEILDDKIYVKALQREILLKIDKFFLGYHKSVGYENPFMTVDIYCVERTFEGETAEIQMINRFERNHSPKWSGEAGVIPILE